MPKPKSLGFPYFSQDTDTFQDVKIRLLISQHGCAGYTVWEYLKQAAYRENGYYVEWNDERKELAAADLYLSVENIGLIVSYLLKRSLLVSKSFNGVTVLTSHGIQKRFQEMAKSAKRDYYNFLPEVWLLSDEETYHSVFCTHCSDNSGIKGDNSGIKGDNSGIIPQKKSKVKESKVYNTHTQSARSAREERANYSSDRESKKSDEELRDLPSPKPIDSNFGNRFNEFVERWGIYVDTSTWDLADFDFDKLDEAFRNSTKFLQKYEQYHFLSWIVKNYARIIKGKYKDIDFEEQARADRPIVDTSDPDYDISGLDKIHYD